MKVLKKTGIILLCLVGVIVIFAAINVIRTAVAVSNQTNAPIDMSKVADGVYTGKSDGGLVQVEVEVTVKGHAIEKIVILRHANGKGEAAESIVNDMVDKNTYDVDIVSSATASSNTIKNAVNVALQQGLEP